jgi:hypothetical protein
MALQAPPWIRFRSFSKARARPRRLQRMARSFWRRGRLRARK